VTLRIPEQAHALPSLGALERGEGVDRIVSGIMASEPKPPPRWAVHVNVLLLRLGLPIGSQRLLTIRGRRSGLPRSTPISVVVLDGRRYVVAALPGMDWVKNARAAGDGVMARGRHRECIRLVELPVEERGPVLRAFLEQVPGGVKYFGVSPDPDVLAASAVRYPVFRVEAASGT